MMLLQTLEWQLWRGWCIERLARLLHPAGRAGGSVSPLVDGLE
jgi:hypothetical protein